SERGQGDGLARCIRAMRGAGDASVRGSVDALIQLCDAAVGAPVMADIQRRFAGPADLDLTKLWERLGVSQSDVGIEFSERGALTRRNLFDPQQFPVPLP
ncbi:MAG: hypothetical protein ACKVH0_09595, partial [Alphaproteobacteria bacterium]